MKCTLEKATNVFPKHKNEPKGEVIWWGRTENSLIHTIRKTVVNNFLNGRVEAKNLCPPSEEVIEKLKTLRLPYTAEQWAYITTGKAIELDKTLFEQAYALALILAQPHDTVLRLSLTEECAKAFMHRHVSRDEFKNFLWFVENAAEKIYPDLADKLCYLSIFTNTEGDWT